MPLPIPDPGSPIAYSDIGWTPNEQPRTVGDVIEEITHGNVEGKDPAHLDPDLDPRALPRPNGWRPLFGQTGAAQGHLRNQGVGPGDVFLFYGWFRQAKWIDGALSFSEDGPDLHVLFGWFQVSEVYQLDETPEQAPAWARYHPHFFGDRGRNNTLYVAGPHLRTPKQGSTLPGAGTFAYFHPDLVLTASGGSRTQWALPRWFYPDRDRPPLTYHGDIDRWSLGPDHVLLDSASRGQEFVLDAARYPESWTWVKTLVRDHRVGT